MICGCRTPGIWRCGCGWPRTPTSDTFAGPIRPFTASTASNMTRARTPLVDLRQRRLAFEVMLETCAAVLPDAGRLSNIIHRKLSWEALWRAARAYDRGRTQQIPVDELVAFALDCWPDADRLRYTAPSSCAAASVPVHALPAAAGPVRRGAEGAELVVVANLGTAGRVADSVLRPSQRRSRVRALSAGTCRLPGKRPPPSIQDGCRHEGHDHREHRDRGIRACSTRSVSSALSY